MTTFSPVSLEDFSTLRGSLVIACRPGPLPRALRAAVTKAGGDCGSGRGHCHRRRVQVPLSERALARRVVSEIGLPERAFGTRLSAALDHVVVSVEAEGLERLPSAVLVHWLPLSTEDPTGEALSRVAREITARRREGGMGCDLPLTPAEIETVRREDQFRREREEQAVAAASRRVALALRSMSVEDAAALLRGARGVLELDRMILGA